MKKAKAKFIFIVLIVLTTVTLRSYSQPFTLEIQVNNQPDNHIILEKISGDDFKPLDTLLVHPVNKTSSVNSKAAQYTFPENLSIGMYRLIFGKTTYARVMDEDPQQLDFIFNNEDIILETNFDAPEDSLLAILSEENRVWFEFLRKKKQIETKLKNWEKEVDYYQNKNVSGTDTKVQTAIAHFNSLQKERDDLITEMVSRYPNLLATSMIKMYREPFLDGNLSQQQRQAKFQKDFFNTLDFTDERLINSSVYTNRIFYYLTSYNQPGFTKQQLENEYIKAVDVVIAHTNKNPKVYEFILGYLVHGFEVLKMDKVIDYIADNYSGTTCQTDEKTTLERKLAAREMKPGTVVPDFTMNDINGDPVTLSEVQKDKTLLLFWASWCPHCSKMIPYIKSWANQHNVEVVAVSLDTSKTEWKEGVSNLGMESWFNVSDLKQWDGKVATEYNVFATPTMFIIDKNRKILAKPVTNIDLAELKVE